MLRLAQPEQLAQRQLVEPDVARHERASQREEGECRPPRRLALGGHEVHRIQEALRAGLEMVLERLVVPVADGGVDAEPLPLGGDPRAALLGAARRFGGRAEQVVGDLHEREPPGAPLLLRERVESCVVERELEPDVAEDAAAEVHPHVGGRHGGEVAALVHEDLGQPGAVDGLERGHVRVARRAELADHLGLPSAERHLVVRVEQPVGVEEALQPVAAVVLEAVARVQVEQLGGEPGRAVDAVDRVVDGLGVRGVGHEARERHADGAQPRLGGARVGRHDASASSDGGAVGLGG